MATIRKQRHIDTPVNDAWAALRDWGAPHERLVPGFVTATRLDGEDRIVTFFNGMTVRELLVALDEQERRLVWSVVEGPYTHHNGAAQVLPDPDGGTQFVWTADLLPHELAQRTDEMMERGIEVLKQTLEAQTVALER
ncbi:MAG TPA: SRPBCC family protein [Solirubrobacteraceae bacterium]